MLTQDANDLGAYMWSPSVAKPGNSSSSCDNEDERKKEICIAGHACASNIWVQDLPRGSELGERGPRSGLLISRRVLCV